MRRFALCHRAVFFALTATLVVAAGPRDLSAQIFVYPRRPSQTNVRYSEFDWRYIDIRRGEDAAGDTVWDTGPRLHHDRGTWKIIANTGTPAQVPAPPTPPAETEPNDVERGDVRERSGGVRLYFYERERELAERAAASVANAYDYLGQQFDYVPTRRFPYFLYNTYQEFLQTNLFPVQEGVLGVTSIEGLEMALPYFGDHQQFERISTHELVHQFTIQKVRTVARREGARFDPLLYLPLWFIEGMAEYYSLGGLDRETRMMLRDLVLHSEPEEDYTLPDFFEPLPPTFFWTYKVGQARVAFLEQVYGRGTVQQILESSSQLGLRSRTAGGPAGAFSALVSEVTGESREEITDEFERWARRKAYRGFFRGRMQAEQLRPMPAAIDGIQALSMSRDGELIMYRGFDQTEGRAKLYLADYREPDDAKLVAEDRQPGIESLHPIGGRTFSVARNAVAFVARTGARDVIYWQPLTRRLKSLTVTEEDGRPQRVRTAEVDIDLGDREMYDLSAWGLVALDALRLGPQGRKIAFIGVDHDGNRDVFLLDPTDDGVTVARLTDDVHAERGLAWGDGEIVYTSSATGHNKFNLFAVDPETGARRRLTTQARDQMDPAAFPSGSTFFVEYDSMGANVYEVAEDGVIRRSNVSTGLFDVGPAPAGGAWALQFFEGERRLVYVPQSAVIGERRATEADTGVVRRPSTLSLDAARDYEAFDPGHWRIGDVFGLLGASSEGIYGQVAAVATDRLRNHTLALTAIIFGSLDLTDGALFYTDQEKRTIWGGGGFQDITFRVDRTFEDEGLLFRSAERFFGATGTLRYPFDQFRFVQAGLSVGGAEEFLTDNSELILESGDINGTGRDLTPEWEAQRVGLELRTRGSLSIGYNSLRFNPFTGPIGGSSALLETSLSVQPASDEEPFGTTRLDAERYVPLWGRSNVLLRVGSGYSFGGDLARGFFLSSFDTIRGIEFGDDDLLLGRAYLFSTAELQFPLETFFSVPVLDLEGVVGMDFGGVGRNPEAVWDRRVLDAVAGVNFGFGPLLLRLHFAKPFDVGGAVPNGGSIVPNFSVAYRYRGLQ